MGLSAISRQLMLGALCLGLLAGCEALPPAGAGGTTAAPARSVPPKPPSRLAIDGVVIAAPQGYCIDKRASDAGRAGFVLLASCSAISQSPEHAAPGRKGLLTATIGDAGSALGALDPKVLDRHFRSAEGRASLANTGNPDSVRIAASQMRGSAYYIALLDRSPPSQPDLGPARWRALFSVKGRMVSAVLHSLSDDPISKEAGLRLLQEFVERIQKASAGP